jgi:hypothetical protein
MGCKLPGGLPLRSSRPTLLSTPLGLPSCPHARARAQSAKPTLEPERVLRVCRGGVCVCVSARVPGRNLSRVV